MALEAQVVGTRGRLEGDPQLRGHFGRIPFLLAPTVGDILLLDDAETEIELGDFPEVWVEIASDRVEGVIALADAPEATVQIDETGSETTVEVGDASETLVEIDEVGAETEIEVADGKGSS